MPINLSTVLEYSTPETMVAMRSDLVAEAKRLEAYHGKIDAYITDNNRDEPPKECERKPLKHYSGYGLFAVIRDSDNAVMATDYRQEDAKQKAVNCGYPCSVVRVMEPVGNECHTERIAPEGCEWGIMNINPDGWIGWAAEGEQWAYILTSTDIKRFPSKADAATYINMWRLENCQPWPIPPKGGAE